MKQITTIIVILYSAAVFYACNNQNKKTNADCSTPQPKAIFKNKSPEISNHTFSLKGRNSEETMQFADGSKVTIYQSGCEKIEQEFRFALQPLPDQGRVPLAIDRLRYMSKLGPEYMSFEGWAQAIMALQKDFAQSSAVEVESGFFVGLDKLDSQERTTLIIKLFEQ